MPNENENKKDAVVVEHVILSLEAGVSALPVIGPTLDKAVQEGETGAVLSGALLYAVSAIMRLTDGSAETTLSIVEALTRETIEGYLTIKKIRDLEEELRGSPDSTTTH